LYLKFTETKIEHLKETWNL